MFNLGVYKKVIHFKTFLTRQKSSEVGYASSHFSSAGPHNLYVVGKVHGVHFRTATRFFGCSKIWGALGMVQETKVIKLIWGEGKLTVDR